MAGDVDNPLLRTVVSGYCHCCPHCREWLPVSLPELQAHIAAERAVLAETVRRRNARQRSEQRAAANRVAKRRAKKARRRGGR